MAKNKVKRITIKDVAARAGVTPAIVSRVVNHDETLNVKEETRQAVMNAVAALHYVPNLVARSMITKRNNVIGVIIADIMNPFFTQIIKEIQITADKYGYSVLLFDTGDDPEKELRAIEMVAQQRVDGVILGTIFVGDNAIVKLEELGLDYVMLNRLTTNSAAPYVRSDDVKGMGLAVDYLVNQGHRDIALLSGPLYADTALNRLSGFRKALHEKGIPFFQSNVIETKFDESSGFSACMELLKLEKRPTAICAANDMVAIGAIRAVREFGLSVPTDISVVGYNDIWICEMLDPALTTVDVKINEMARQAFQMLVRLIASDQDKPLTNVELEPELVVRRSVACR